MITAFDAVHDQRSPRQVLRRVRAALAPGGVFVMVDAKFSSHLAGNMGNPLAALCYAISLLYCTPVGLDGGGAGLGAMWGTERPARCWPRPVSARSRCWTHPGRRTASSPAGGDRTRGGQAAAQTSCGPGSGMVICGDG